MNPAPQKSAEEILAHPRFAEARNDLIDGFLHLFVSKGPFLVRLFADAGCLMLASVLVGLHASDDENDRATLATHGRVQQLVVDRGLASRRRLDDLIARFRQMGYVDSVASAADKRLRILRPTERLLAHDRTYMAVFHLFLHRLYPDRGYKTGPQLDPRTHLALRRAGSRSQPFASAFMRHRVMTLFLAHDTGTMALLAVLQATRANDPAALSFSAIGRRLGVSHTHIRNIFTQAAAEGYVTLGGEASSVHLLPKIWSEYDRMLADVESTYDAIAQAAFASLRDEQLRERSS